MRIILMRMLIVHVACDDEVFFFCPSFYCCLFELWSRCNESLLMMIMMMMFTMTMMIITIFLLPQMSLLFVAVFPCLSALRQTRQPKENIWRKHRPQKNIAGKKNIAAEKHCRQKNMARKKKLPAKKTLPAKYINAKKTSPAKKHGPQKNIAHKKNIACKKTLPAKKKLAERKIAQKQKHCRHVYFAYIHAYMQIHDRGIGPQYPLPLSK